MGPFILSSRMLEIRSEVLFIALSSYRAAKFVQ
jgi:hypothetical protein